MDLGALVDQLLSDDAYASGRRSFPRTVTPDDAVEITRYAHDQIDAGTRARAEAAQRNGFRIACGRGCRKCCAEPVHVYAAEALAIARWLDLPENAAARAAFLEAYPRWREAVGDAPERLSDLAAAKDWDTYVAAQTTELRKGILCAFNAADGDCLIHPVRPAVCRNAHAVDTSDYCGADHPSGKPATHLQFIPLDQFLQRNGSLERAMHHALGGARSRPESVCVAVHRLLTGTPAAPR